MPRRQLQRQAQYGARNIEAAEVILDNGSAHGGEQSAIVQWARLVLIKSGKLTDLDREAEPAVDCKTSGQPQNGLS